MRVINFRPLALAFNPLPFKRGVSDDVEAQNEANIRINQERNDIEMQLQREQNAFNREQWNLNNDYNTPAAVMGRMIAAGISPSTAAQSVAGVPSYSSPVQQTSIPNLSVPTIQGAQDSKLKQSQIATSGMNDIFNNLGQMRNLNAQTEKLKAETKNISERTPLELNELMARTGLQRSQVPYYDAMVNKTYSDVQSVQQGIKESASRIKNMDSQTAANQLHTYFESEAFNDNLGIIKNQYKMSEQGAKYFGAQLRSQIAVNLGLSDYYKEASNLAHEQAQTEQKEREKIDAIISLYTADTKGKLLNNSIVEEYGKPLAEQELSEAEYNNSALGRGTSALRDIGVGLGAALGGAAAVKNATKKKDTPPTNTRTGNVSSNVYNNSTLDFLNSSTPIQN